MAEENKTQLTEEEKIERKAKLFRLISRILIGIAVIIIGVFIYYAVGTKQNIATDKELIKDTIKVANSIKNG